MRQNKHLPEMQEAAGEQTAQGMEEGSACSERARCIVGTAVSALPGMSGIDMGRGLPGTSPGMGLSLSQAHSILDLCAAVASRRRSTIQQQAW